MKNYTNVLKIHHSFIKWSFKCSDLHIRIVTWASSQLYDEIDGLGGSFLHCGSMHLLSIYLERQTWGPGVIYLFLE